MAIERQRRAPLFDTLERVMDHSIVVDGPSSSTRRAPAVTPSEWIHAAGDKFVIARAQPEPGGMDDEEERPPVPSYAVGSFVRPKGWSVSRDK